VIIPGFGTFSFIHKRIDIGNNRFLLFQRPVFALSEKIAQTHGLKSTRYPINGSIPVHPLNYFYIQTQSIYTRDQIEQCVKHVLQIFNRSIAAQRNVEFTFSHIGKLHIRSGKVKMRFFKDFVSAVDENAAKLVIENMCNVRDREKNFCFIHETISHYPETTNMRFSDVRTRSSKTPDCF
jgi:nucleoid DNA-binding protein